MKPEIQDNSESITVFHDFFEVNGGAEAVACTLWDSLRGAKLVTAYYSVDRPVSIRKENEFVSLGKPIRNPFLKYLLSIWRFRTRTRFASKSNVNVFMGPCSLSAVWHSKGGRNIHYCHSIPRFAYDLSSYWIRRAAWWQKPALVLLIFLMRRHYSRAVRKIDVLVSNSNNVRERTFRYLNIDSLVVHPPCDTTSYNWIGQESYYLSTARLEPYKRVNLILQAFLRMPDKNLVILSDGSEMEALTKLASGATNIEVVGWASKEILVNRIGNCICTIYVPIDEDFGISPVESLAAGKPVIGVASGGLLETIKHEQTGYLISEPKHLSESEESLVSDIVKAVNWMTPARALQMRQECESCAEKFDTNVFLKKMNELVSGSNESTSKKDH